MITDTMSYIGLSFLSGIMLGALGKTVVLFLKRYEAEIMSVTDLVMGRKSIRVAQKPES
jgi:hypothetical protein